MYYEVEEEEVLGPFMWGQVSARCGLVRLGCCVRISYGWIQLRRVMSASAK
jgi:hypothetical protein